MNLWGVTPLLAATLLGGSIGSHAVSVHHITQPAVTRSTANQKSSSNAPSGPFDAEQSALRAVSASTPAPTGPSLAMTTPVLQQVSAQTWQAMVLQADANTGCRGHYAYWLETNSPGSPFPGRSTLPKTLGKTTSTGASSTATSLCEVTVSFTLSGQVPATATLLLYGPGGPSSLLLTVSRNVTLIEYLAVPAAVGMAMVVLLFLSAIWFVKVYDFQDKKRIYFFKTEFWRYTIFASGAWTLTDSWATNIAAAVAVLATIFTTTSAADSIFPGVALDRFAILNVVAGGIVTATPLVFGVFYARWTAKNPGPTADALISLPQVLCATVPRGCNAVLSASIVQRS